MSTLFTICKKNNSGLFPSFARAVQGLVFIPGKEQGNVGRIALRVYC
jgi:hypothetical protein